MLFLEFIFGATAEPGARVENPTRQYIPFKDITDDKLDVIYNSDGVWDISGKTNNLEVRSGFNARGNTIHYPCTCTSTKEEANLYVGPAVFPEKPEGRSWPTFYTIYLPPNLEDMKYVLIDIYGGGQDKDYYAYTNLYRLLAHSGVAVISLRLTDVIHPFRYPRDHPQAGHQKYQGDYTKEELDQLLYEVAYFVKNLKNLSTMDSGRFEKLGRVPVFLTGVSYGGFNAFRMATRPEDYQIEGVPYQDLFAGFIAQRGPTFRWKDKYNPKSGLLELEGGLDQLKKDLDPLYSPVLDFENLKKPLLFTIGTKDDLVNVMHAAEAVDMAKFLGKDDLVSLYTAKGVEHVNPSSYDKQIPRDPESLSRLDGYAQVILGFMDNVASGSYKGNLTGQQAELRKRILEQRLIEAKGAEGMIDSKGKFAPVFDENPLKKKLFAKALEMYDSKLKSRGKERWLALQISEDDPRAQESSWNHWYAPRLYEDAIRSALVTYGPSNLDYSYFEDNKEKIITDIINKLQYVDEVEARAFYNAAFDNLLKQKDMSWDELKQNPDVLPELTGSVSFNRKEVLELFYQEILRSMYKKLGWWHLKDLPELYAEYLQSINYDALDVTQVKEDFERRESREEMGIKVTIKPELIERWLLAMREGGDLSQPEERDVKIAISEELPPDIPEEEREEYQMHMQMMRRHMLEEEPRWIKEHLSDDFKRYIIDQYADMRAFGMQHEKVFQGFNAKSSWPSIIPIYIFDEVKEELHKFTKARRAAFKETMKAGVLSTLTDEQRAEAHKRAEEKRQERKVHHREEIREQESKTG